MTVSVIVPVYKVEQYLRPCVDSILAQTYTDLEIILVNDGSPDGCGKICDEYAGADSRVTVIHKENGGLSSARNAGIDIASGAYITFVDSDDWIAAGMIETLYRDITGHNAGMAACGYAAAYADGSCVPAFAEQALLCFDTEQAIECFCRRYALSVNAWGKLYKAEVFDGLRYPEGKIYEDAFIILDVLSRAGTVTVRTAPMYYYRQRKSGIILDRSGRYASDKAHGKQAWEKNLRFTEERYPPLIGAVTAIYWTSCLELCFYLCRGGRHLPQFSETRAVICGALPVLLKSPYLTKREKLTAFLLKNAPRLLGILIALAARAKRKKELYS